MIYWNTELQSVNQGLDIHCAVQLTCFHRFYRYNTNCSSFNLLSLHYLSLKTQLKMVFVLFSLRFTPTQIQIIHLNKLLLLLSKTTFWFKYTGIGKYFLCLCLLNIQICYATLELLCQTFDVYIYYSAIRFFGFKIILNATLIEMFQNFVNSLALLQVEVHDLRGCNCSTSC